MLLPKELEIPFVCFSSLSTKYCILTSSLYIVFIFLRSCGTSVFRLLLSCLLFISAMCFMAEKLKARLSICAYDVCFDFNSGILSCCNILNLWVV